jgi:hypothetical protein
MVPNTFSSLRINPERGKEVALALFRKFNSKDGIFGHHTMPEDLLPRWGSDLTASGIARGSYDQLMFITLVVSIDYQRDADQLWAAGRKTFENNETRWLFYPEKLVQKPKDIKKSLQTYKLSKKPEKDAGIWSMVSKSFLEQYGSNPLNLVAECDYDAAKIYQKKFNLRFKKSFPYFSGDKIFPLWIRMLNDNLRISLRNIDQIPIPVDVHIARATFATGCLTGEYQGNISQVAPKIDESWKATMALINDAELKYRLQLDEPLWHLSRFGCTFRKNGACKMKQRCPVSQSCVEGIVKVSAKRVEIRTGSCSAATVLSLDNFAPQRRQR